MPEMKDLEGKHRGSLGFVVGAGPSLHFQDIEPLRDYVTIAVNSALPKVKFCDYFIADDIGVKNWNYYRKILPDLDCVSLLYDEKLKAHVAHLDGNKIVWFKHKWWFDPKNKTYNPVGLEFTADANLPLIGARTTAGSAVHGAFIMGCDPIVLLGCDCCYKGNKRYYWQFEGEEKCYRLTGEPVFSTPNRGVHEGRPVDSHSMDFIDYWGAVAKQADKQGIKIIDASDGLLTCFEKMSLPAVLEKYGNRRKANGKV